MIAEQIMFYKTKFYGISSLTTLSFISDTTCLVGDLDYKYFIGIVLGL